MCHSWGRRHLSWVVAQRAQAVSMAVCAGTSLGSKDSVENMCPNPGSNFGGRNRDSAWSNRRSPDVGAGRWRAGEGRGPADTVNEPPAWWAQALPLSSPWPPSLMNPSPSCSTRASEGLWVLKRTRGQLSSAALSLCNSKIIARLC